MDSQECSNCSNQTTQMCSACKDVSFCSRECQKTLWPVHKHLCGKDLSTLSLPPLSPLERDDILATRNNSFDHVCNGCVCRPQTAKQGATLIEHVNSLGLFEKEVDIGTLIDSISAGGSLIEEPRLSACLVLARASLFTRRSGLDEIRPSRAGEHDLTIWNRAAMQMSKYISCRPASEHFANFESNPFRVFSQFFRHELVLATHLTNFKDKGVHNKNLIILAVKRLFRELPALRQSCINKALFDRITDTAVQYQLVFGVNLEQSLREGDTRRRT